MKQMQSSVNAQIVTIMYSLKVFVKHDSVTQRGEGECITMPIRIISKVP